MSEDFETFMDWMKVRADMRRFRLKRIKRIEKLGAPDSIEHYEGRVDYRKGRVNKLKKLGAPEDLVLHEKWLLQEAKADLAFKELVP